MCALALAAVALSLALLMAPARAQTAQQVETRAADVVAVLQGATPAAEVFTPAFLEAIPESQVKELATQMEGQFGPLQGLSSVTPMDTPGAAQIALKFERAVGRGRIQLETTAPFRVAGLRITAFEAQGDTAQKVMEELAALPGEVGVLLARMGDPEPIVAHRADAPLAVGSAMKLYVLSALAHEIAAGKRKWGDVVPLTVRSLPSGQMQDWPQGSPVTLHTLATQMIAISDNTATDALIGLLGRAAVEQEMRASGHARPLLNVPFLTTREVFLLKSGDTGRLRTYAHAAEGDRGDMLSDLAGEQLDQEALDAAFNGLPRALDVEWFASARDLAAILHRIRRLEDRTALEVLSVNTALTPEVRAFWDYAGYKGGSEPGVLNLSWLLRDKAGGWYVLAMSWNDPAALVDEQRFHLLSQRLMALAKPASE